MLPVSPWGLALPNWTTESIRAESFEKAGWIAMCDEGPEVLSDLDERGFILLNEDIDAVFDWYKMDIRLPGARDKAQIRPLSIIGPGVKHRYFSLLL
jgi:hypothetical protein